MASRFLILALALVVTIAISLSPAALGQIINNPCTPSMITALTSCMNFPTNSSVNGTTAPAKDCCNSMKSLMTSGKDCLCLVATTSIPFQIPINRTFIASLPRACNMSGVPLQCKATGAPAPSPSPSPGPVANGPSVSSPPPPPLSVPVPSPPQPASPTSAPGVDASPSPPGPPASGGAPPSNTSSRAGTTPSAGQLACTISPFLSLLAMLGVAAFKYH